jgi:alpha-glucosidase
MPWSGVAPPYGFTTGTSTWLPMSDDWASLTVEAESADPDSTLALYQQALALRRKTADLRGDEFTWLDSPPGCLMYRRGAGLVVALNAGDQSVPLPAGDLVLASGPIPDGTLPPDTAVWIRG